MNQKKNRGFTLIELLAVIVILAIIALIAVPIIMNIISKANESVFKDTAYGIISAGELYFAERQLEPNGMTSDVTITLPDTTKTLQLKGEVPTGQILITKEGKVSIAVHNNRYCVTKGLEDKDVKVTEDVANCELTLPEKTLSDLATTSIEVTSIPACLNDGIECIPGTPVAIKVNENDVYNFYVISETDNEITLIMERNLYSPTDENYGNVAWINAEDYVKANADDNTTCEYDACSDEGPLTAISVLKERTSGWTNIPERVYTYSDDGGGNKYESFTEIMRARMLTYTEAIHESIGCTSDDDSCPDWLYKNLYGSGGIYSFWLSSAKSGFHHVGVVVSRYGRLDYNNNQVFQTTSYGIRPVITLTK